MTIAGYLLFAIGIGAALGVAPLLMARWEGSSRRPWFFSRKGGSKHG